MAPSTAVRNLRLLIVEDNAEDAALIERSLAGVPLLTTRVVGDGYAAIHALGNDPPDLVLLDLGLPGKDGFEVLDWAQSHGVAAPIVVLSGADPEAERERVYELGARTIVRKPNNRAEFESFVRGLFDLWMRSLVG